MWEVILLSISNLKELNNAHFKKDYLPYIAKLKDCKAEKYMMDYA